MKPTRQPFFRPLALKAFAAAVALAASGLASAAQTDLATVPLQTSVTNVVRPNLLFTLDESGSMQSEYIPDYVNDSGFCRSGNPGGNPSTNACDNGDVPYSANAFNGIYYNPLVTYTPPVKWDGTSFLSQNSANTAGWTKVYDSPAANDDPFIAYVNNTSPSTTNIVSQFREAFFCTNNSGNTCKRNGIDAADTTNKIFDYWQPMSTASGGANDAAFPKTVSGTNYTTRVYKTQSAPFYYDMVPTEYCRDANLSECVQSTSPTGLYTFPAYVRFCQTKAQATSTSVQSDNIGTLVPKCVSKFINQGAQQWTFARYAKFKRTDIVSTTATYGGRPSRTDCVGAPTCTFAEEMTNFANWYAYYRSRILMMKTGTGLAFRSLDDRYRIGFITIHPGSPVQQWNGTSGKFLPVKPFDATQKKAFYAILYSQSVGQATPLREALSRAGRYFANVRTGINQGINDDPMEYSCQPNFLLLTTDGFWNTGDPIDLKGNNFQGTDVDNVPTGPYSSRAQGAFDGNIGAKGTLADTALYYYQTDLRDATSMNNCTSGTTGADVCKDNVPTTTSDPNQKQHMVTFTLGLSDGIMRYQPDYDTSATGDFARIKSGASNSCVWATGTCNWPAPQADQQSALDDLWHAAVNGRGKYYKATDPTALNVGLTGALSNIQGTTAAAAAAATSTPNITKSDNFAFSSTYRTTVWWGQVIKQEIDTGSGVVLPPVLWDAQSQLDALTWSNRKIYYRDPNATNPTLAAFDFNNLMASTTLKGYFENQCLLLSQCTFLSPVQQGPAGTAGTLNDGKTMVNYLRGERANEGPVYRTREHVLGDTVNAAPAYVAKPQFNFGDAVTPDYATFRDTSTRPSALYIGANDGMLHAFDGASGQELWAYVPTMVMKKMSGLADLNYAQKHTYFVDGSPVTMDAYWGGAWHTVLIAGLNKGGNGYYALDVTNPASPKVLWEVCNDSTLCGGPVYGDSDPDIGLTYGNPIVTKLPPGNANAGKWVAIFASGYNNVTGPTVADRGVGYLYVVDLVTGKILNKLRTTAGDQNTPSGLAKITAIANDFAVDNTALAVYGGDLLGNVWKFDLAVAPSVAVKRIARLSSDTAGANPEPITTRPEVTKIQGSVVLYVATGKYLGATDLPDVQQQSVFAFKDTNADLGWLRGRPDMVPTDITGATTTTVDWTQKSGWITNLATSGERVNIDPQLIQGTLLVVSNAPDADACSTGGESFLYQLNYLNPGKPPTTGASVGTSITRLGSAVAVGLTVIRLPSGAIKAIIPLADTSKSTQDVKTFSVSVSTRRIGWRQLFQ